MRKFAGQRARRVGHIETTLAAVGLALGGALWLAALAVFQPSKIVGLLLMVPAIIVGLGVVVGAFLWFNRGQS